MLVVHIYLFYPQFSVHIILCWSPACERCMALMDHLPGRLVSLHWVSCVRRRWRQTGDITSSWGQSCRNRQGASRSAVIVITTLTQPRTHTYANTHSNTIVSSKLSVWLVYWHNFEALCIFVCLCDMSLSWSHFLYAFLGTSYLVSFIVVCFHNEIHQISIVL